MCHGGRNWRPQTAGLGLRAPLCAAHLGQVTGSLPALPRPDQVTVLDTYQYDDGCEPCGNDTFSREPAIVRFHSPLTSTHPFLGSLESPGHS